MKRWVVCGSSIVKYMNANMGRVHYFLSSLIWISACSRIVIGQNIENVTDGIPTAVSDVVSTEVPECEWNAFASGESLGIIWSGNSDPYSDVWIEAGIIFNDTNCPIPAVNETLVFSDNSTELEICTNEKYRIDIVFFNCSTNIGSKEIWTPPGPPAEINFTNVKNESFDILWEKPTGSGKIELYNITVTDSTTGDEEIYTSINESASIIKLKPYTNYGARVSAKNSDFWGIFSSEMNITTKQGVPCSPTDLISTGKSNTTVDLEWKEPLEFTGFILNYVIECRNSSHKQEMSTQSNETKYSIKSLIPFVEYTFRVAGNTTAGTGTWSNEHSVKTKVGIPHAPTNFEEIEVGNTSIYFRWEEPSISTGPIHFYRIYWKNSTSSGEEDTNSACTNYTFQRLTPYTDYTFKVLATTEAGPGSWSTEINIQTKVGIPHAPASLIASNVFNTSIEFKWNQPMISTGPITEYRIHWRNSSGSGEVDTNSSDPSYILRGLAPDVEYTFKVLALTEAGPGEWSDAKEFRTKIGVPHAPMNFEKTKLRNTSIDFKWEKPIVSTGPIIFYRIHWKNSSEGEVDTGSRDTNYTLKGLTPYVNYTFKILAVTEVGPGSWSKELNIQTEIGVPHPPTNFNYKEKTNNSVFLTWLEPKPSTGPITSYIVRWSSSRNSGSKDINSTEQSYNVKGLFPYVMYTFDVVASTTAGIGEWSKSKQIQTEIGVPTATRNLCQESITNTSVSIRWDRPEFPNAPELNYIIVRKFSSREKTNVSDTTISVSSDKESIDYIILNLLPYTTYSIKIFAATRAGEGPASNELQIQTNVGYPEPAVILNVKVLRNQSALVHWMTRSIYPGPVDFSLQTWEYPSLCSDKTAERVVKELKGNKSSIEWNLNYETLISELSPFGKYAFLIILKTSATEGVESNMSESVRLPPEASSEPLEVIGECINSPTDLKVSWKPPREPNGLIEYYNIEYSIESETEKKVRKIVVKDMCRSQSYILTGLRPERRYQIAIQAKVKDVETGGKLAHPVRNCNLPAGIPFLGDTSRLLAKSDGPETLAFEWTDHVFSDYMGEIIQYAVLVGRLESLGNATNGKSAKIEPPWSNFTSGSSSFYQATPRAWNPFKNGSDPLKCKNFVEVESNKTFLRCFIGSEKTCLENKTYCNGPLDPDTPYELKIRAFTRGGYAETDLLYARSSPAPRPSVAGKVITVIFTLFLLLALGASFYILKKKGYIEPLTDRIISRFQPQTKESSAKRESSALPMEPTVSTSKNVKLKDFAQHVKKMMIDSHILFSLEFEELKNISPQLPCSIAETEENRSKNRWMNIFPFDHTRVKLLPLCDDPSSDFINANYIPGYYSRREYIATQGPLPHTIDDFWRMVWEQSVSVIVMLTQCVERGKKKCEKYWPDSGDSQYYGDLRITTVSESMLSSYIIRIFHVHLGSYKRQIKQMHFTRWPDFGCPECPEDLINFVNAVRDHFPRSPPGPMLVHCSAGVGRTGTFIAVDRLSLQLRNSNNLNEDAVDIFGTILELRTHRTNMVQTEDQYIYIYFCVRQLTQNLQNSEVVDGEDIYSNMAVERDTPI